MADFNSTHTGTEIDDAVGVAKGAGTGIIVKNGTGSGAKRTITGTTNEVTVANGDGVSGNPTLSLAAAATASLALANTATQPGDLATVATTGDYTDLISLPTLGTAAATDTIDYATAAQGTLADTAVQPGDLGTAATTDATDYATAAQGALADTATQPGDLATVATTGSYNDLASLPTLGTAAATAATDYATAAQGALADTALQAADITNMVESDPTGVTGADAITNIMSLTQAEYDAIVTPNASTLYVITA